MGIKVKRNTGMMGGTMKVSLSVNGQKISKLGNDEEYIIDSNKDSAKLKVKQWYFGSPEKEVDDQSHVEIKINALALFLFVISLALIIIGAVMTTPIVIGIGVIGAIVTMIYAVKNWFELEVIKSFTYINKH